MIPRYECKEISSIWTQESRLENFLKVELALLETLEENQLIPKGVYQTIKDKAQVNVERANEIEKTTHHDIIAFCTSITENVSEDIGKYFHFGVTSSDIIDTAVNLQIKDSLSLILPEFKTLLMSLKKKANQYKNLICMGRSHGMFAEPMSFGQKFLGSYAELSRRYQELQNFYQHDITGQLSGAVGNYCILTTEIEEQALKKLDLKVEAVSTQVISRDYIAKMVSIISLAASAIERLCTEIRHLHHSDLQEVHEGFSKGQKGSSTMPHKKNPISGENLTGMARILRSHLIVAHENIPLWHERDISHSSTERMYLPDHLGLFFYTLKRLSKTIDDLVVHEEVIENKVRENFTYLSSYFLHHLIQNYKGTRELFYEIVQSAAFNSTNSNEFGQNVIKFSQEKGIKVTTLPTLDFEEIKRIYLKQIEGVFQRTYRQYE